MKQKVIPCYSVTKLATWVELLSVVSVFYLLWSKHTYTQIYGEAIFNDANDILVEAVRHFGHFAHHDSFHDTLGNVHTCWGSYRSGSLN